MGMNTTSIHLDQPTMVSTDRPNNVFQIKKKIVTAAFFIQ